MNIQNLFKILAFTLASIFFAGVIKANAQADDSHFIYIQAENRKPFYVILNDKLYSSSSIGYLIVPKLKSGTYNLTLGFPQNAAPEQKFVSVVKNNDIGYSLKSIDKNTYTLTDLQTQEVLTSGNSPQAIKVEKSVPVVNAEQPAKTREPQVEVKEPVAQQPEPVVEKTVVTQVPTPVKEPEVVAPPEEKKNRTFGDLMSDVTNDPELAKVEEVKPAQPKKDPFQEVKIVRTGNAQNEVVAEKPVETAAVVAPVVTQTPVVKPRETAATIAPQQSDTYGVIRTENKRVANGQEMNFVLLGNTSTDSVKIVVPIEEETVAPPPTSNTTSETSTSTKKSIAYFDYEDLAKPSDVPARTREPKRNRRDKKSSDNNTSNQQSTQQATPPSENIPPVQAVATPVENTSSASNFTASNNCSGGTIADRDFNKLRNKMIGRDNDEEMISTALDALGNKCIETEKVKTLSGLFITDNGRLKFFDAVYKNVSDKQNFSSLQDQIYDKGKKEQFLRLINQ